MLGVDTIVVALEELVQIDIGGETCFASFGTNKQKPKEGSRGPPAVKRSWLCLANAREVVACNTSYVWKDVKEPRKRRSRNCYGMVSFCLYNDRYLDWLASSQDCLRSVSARPVLSPVMGEVVSLQQKLAAIQLMIGRPDVSA